MSATASTATPIVMIVLMICMVSGSTLLQSSAIILPSDNTYPAFI